MQMTFYFNFLAVLLIQIYWTWIRIYKGPVYGSNLDPNPQQCFLALFPFAVIISFLLFSDLPRPAVSAPRCPQVREDLQHHQAVQAELLQTGRSLRGHGGQSEPTACTQLENFWKLYVTWSFVKKREMVENFVT